MTHTASKLFIRQDDFDRIGLIICYTGLGFLGVLLLTTLVSGALGITWLATAGMGALVGVSFCLALVFYVLRRCVEVVGIIDISV